MSVHVSHRTEGDINASPAREAFIAEHLDEATRALLAEDATYFLHQELSTPCFNVLRGCQGSLLIDQQGRRILDFHGNSAHQVGHAHPQVVRAVRDQLDQLAFCPRRFTNRTAIELARRLSERSPVRSAAGPPRVLLAPGGALAMEMAIKLARLTTGRYKTVSMWDSFHGASLGAVSVGGEAQFREGLGPLLPGCLHVPAYAPGRESADELVRLLDCEGDVAAVIAEPMRWTTVVPPPASYWQTIRQACDRHGTLLIIDEIPACLGRTGKLFCTEHFDLQPDILVIGKGLGGGVFPLAAMIARCDLNRTAPSSIGHFTHEKSPLGAAAALATLQIIDSEQLLPRASRLGRHACDQLEAFRRELPVIREVRGLGLQLAVELATPADCGIDSAAHLGERVLYGCLQQGLSFKVSQGNVLTLTPPLTISESELSTAVDILRRVLVRVADHPARA